MSSYNFQKPVKGDLYADAPNAILDQIRAATDSLAKMLDGTGDSSYPTGAKRINSGQGYRLEEWNGSSWGAQTLKLGNLSSALESLTTAEIQQLQNINSNVISGTIWGYVAGMDQDVDTSADLQLGSLTLSGHVDFGATSGVSAYFDGQTNLITVHDGTGNWNFKANVDENNNIISGSGGQRMVFHQSGGSWYVQIDGSTAAGNSFSSGAELKLNPDGTLDVSGSRVLTESYTAGLVAQGVSDFGIGETSPDAPLHIKKNAGSGYQDYIFLEETGTPDGLYISYNANVLTDRWELRSGAEGTGVHFASFDVGNGKIGLLGAGVGSFTDDLEIGGSVRANGPVRGTEFTARDGGSANRSTWYPINSYAANDSANTVSVTNKTLILIQNLAGDSILCMSAFDVLTTIASTGSVSNQGGNTTLGGTTGPDNSLNVSRNNDTLYFENRRGTSSSYTQINVHAFGVNT